jgi:23S rRNA (guanosine2251-2'-O)-methyltransferase
MKPREKTTVGQSIEITSLIAIEHLLEHRPDRFRKIQILTRSVRTETIETRAKALKISVEWLKPNSNLTDGITAILAPFVYEDFKTFLNRVTPLPHSVVVALDHLQDPHNLGAICRTADALGVSGILLPKDRSVAVGPGVYHASVGAVDTIPLVLVANLNDALTKMKDAGFWIVGSGIGKTAKPLSETPDFKKVTLVLGRELEGISANIAKNCDWITEIPLVGKVQSLNVSVAGGILIYEWARRVVGG